jgi:hypothetical protein
VADTWGRRPASDELHHCWQATEARQVKRPKDLELENSRLRAERRAGLSDGTNVRLRTPLERTQGPLLAFRLDPDVLDLLRCLPEKQIGADGGPRHGNDCRPERGVAREARRYRSGKLAP